MFISTRGRCAPATLGEALFRGPAPDGGLYLPEHLEPLAADEIERLSGQELARTASTVAAALFGDSLPADELEAIVSDSLDFEIPLRRIEPGLAVLELFHGPTLAFKDVGARFMARLMQFEARRSPDPPSPESPLTILVATSGDTGSAVAHAFHQLEGFRVVVLFPRGQISEAQRRLFTTLGGNVISVAVRGDFDRCQALVKSAFANDRLRRKTPLAAANSINIGRLLPQSIYYFQAVAQLRSEELPPVFVVPSGNFGNLTAGLLARHIGMPVAGFVAATNVNDTVPRFLGGSDYRPRPSIRTLANAMDVGSPNNFERIRYLYDGDDLALRRALAGFSCTDAEITATIAEVAERTGYVLDPHSAVGHLGATAMRDEGRFPEAASFVVLSTAHPAKFADVVEQAIGRPVDLPPELSRCLEEPEQIVDLEADETALESLLLGL